MWEENQIRTKQLQWAVVESIIYDGVITTTTEFLDLPLKYGKLGNIGKFENDNVGKF